MVQVRLVGRGEVGTVQGPAQVPVGGVEDEHVVTLGGTSDRTREPVRGDGRQC